MLNWPSATDYHEAVQNPRSAFRDGDLMRATPVTDAMGLPRVMTGSFAAVYRLMAGGESWAVRCFLRHVPDRERRYRLISERLSTLRLPCFVDFGFLQDGIRVRGQSYPILKMDWLDGENLDAYIRRNLTNPSQLSALARKWLELMQTLAKAQVAHGDFQHGNIIVAGDELRLVDYDGMWIPELAGEISTEVGHPNYQLPARSAGDFGPWLDNFSACVIYVTLEALASRPGLWGEFNAGNDQCLLFTRADFESPESSRLLGRLESCGEARLQALAERLHDLAYSRPSDVPPPGELASAPPTGGPGALRQPPDWLGEHLAQVPGAAQEQPELGETLPSGNIGWVLDQLPPLEKRRFAMSLWPDRAVALSLLIVTLLLAWSGPIQSPYGLLLWYLSMAVLVAAAAAMRYRQVPAAVARASVLREVAHWKRQRGDLQRQVVAANREDERASKELVRAREEMERQLKLAAEAEKTTIAKARNVMNQALSESRGEQDRISAAIAGELSRALADRQQGHLRQYLQSRTVIGHMVIPGIGPGLKSRLVAAGIATAADITRSRVYVVPGFGDRRVSQVLTWRAEVEAEAQRTMPARLPPAEEQRIRGSYAARTAAVDAADKAARDQAVQQQESARQQHQRRRDDLMQSYRREVAAHDAARCFRRDKAAVLHKSVSDVEWRTAVARRQLQSYALVSPSHYLLEVLFIGAERS